MKILQFEKYKLPTGLFNKRSFNICTNKLFVSSHATIESDLFELICKCLVVLLMSLYC